MVLISGAGSLLQALLEACADPDFGARVVAVGSDRAGAAGLDRARRAGLETFVHPLSEASDRDDWDQSLSARVHAFTPDLVVSAGFLKLLGPTFLQGFGGRTINTHPALLPSFPGVHGPRDALAYGVRYTGATVFLVDAGVDTGVILDQAVVEVEPDDSVESLHERIKVAERKLLVTTTHALTTRRWRVAGRKVHWDL